MFVKYQRLELAQRPTSTANIMPPATGSSQPGYERLRTNSIFTASTP